MSWAEVPFKKYKGKTLPQVVLLDPDWFFWAMEASLLQKSRMLRAEAEEIDRKARNVRIPMADGEDLMAEYVMDRNVGKFCDLKIIPRDQPLHKGSSPTQRKDVIDLSFPRQIASYDKLGCRLLLKSVKYHVFGDSNTRLTKKKCEEFFSDDSNFVLDR